MNQELVQESIDEVMDNFDWEKVHRVMQAIDWKWYHADGEIVTPSISDLRRTARRLLRNVVEGLRIHEQYSAASGGLYAEGYTNPETGDVLLKLAFELESYSNYQ